MDKEECQTKGREQGGDLSSAKCNQCGKNVRDKSLLGGEELSCECNKSDTSSIRLGPVPDSAFRPPSPRPGSKEEHRASSVAAISASGGTKYEIVSIREKHGEFRKAIPCMPMFAAVICCLFNVIIPGTGTLIAGFTILCGCRTEHKERSRALGYNLVAALLQLVTAPLIVGWVWSVLWGMNFINVSASKALQDTTNGASAV